MSGIPWNILPRDPNRTADISPSAEPIMNATASEAAPIPLSAEALYGMSEVELLSAYADARRQFVEKKFTRDTHRARLEWMRATPGKRERIFL